jgi:hypothetical protein
MLIPRGYELLKICQKCDHAKPTGEFRFDIFSRYYLSDTCMSCEVLYGIESPERILLLSPQASRTVAYRERAITSSLRASRLRAIRKKRSATHYTRDDFEYICNNYGNLLDADHVIPLARGGSDGP